MRLMWGLIAYSCIGTVLAVVVLYFHFQRQGRLSSENLAMIAGVLQGVDFQAATREAIEAAKASGTPKVSTQQVADARALQYLDLKLREQALRADLAEALRSQTELAKEAGRYLELKKQFAAELKQLRESVLSESHETARAILESMQPEQAKQQVLTMIKAGEMEQVVRLMSVMTPTKRAKLTQTFETEEDAKTMAEILRRIREGEPEVPLIDRVEQQAGVPASTPNPENL
jgi:hypothetical protein